MIKRLSSLGGLFASLMLASGTSMAQCREGFENPAVTATTPTADFIDNNDGTVTHIRTGLMWKRCSEGQAWDASESSCTGTVSTYTWQQALQAVSQGYAGHHDWRLPNIKELVSIVEERCWSPAINLEIFPNAPSNAYWSSSPNFSEDTGTSFASWNITFSDGTYAPPSKIFPDRVRLVRDAN